MISGTARPAPHSRTFVTGFARGLGVIEAFGPGHKSLSVADMAQRTGLDRAVVRRLLLTLVGLGFARIDGKQFELTPKVLKLGYSFLASSALDATLRPYLEELSTEIGEAVSVSVLDGDEVVFVGRSEPPSHRVAFVVTMGMRLPAYASASGRVLLAALPESKMASLLHGIRREKRTPHTVTGERDLVKLVTQARAEGHAVNWEELEEGLVGIAVPLRNRAGAVVASLNANTNAARAQARPRTRQMLPKLKAMARRMAEVLP
jgi:IclR family transcriptional regulator, pca regulon regulatory protein